MNCDQFRADLANGNRTPDFLEHLRQCPECLELSVAVEPDDLFRSLGGQDHIPPGGVDLFVAEVIQQVHVRETESRMAPRSGLTSLRQWAVAATILVAIAATTLLYRPVASAPAGHPTTTVASTALRHPARLDTVDPALIRPVVENYDSPDATIVEVPTENSSDLKIVMIFDEHLPVDL